MLVAQQRGLGSCGVARFFAMSSPEAMQEEMEGDLKSAQDTEASAVAGFQELSAAKASESGARGPGL